MLYFQTDEFKFQSFSVCVPLHLSVEELHVHHLFLYFSLFILHLIFQFFFFNSQNYFSSPILILIFNCFNLKFIPLFCISLYRSTNSNYQIKCILSILHNEIKRPRFNQDRNISPLFEFRVLYLFICDHYAHILFESDAMRPKYNSFYLLNYYSLFIWLRLKLYSFYCSEYLLFNPFHTTD